ncbi:3-dehydroquinate synthase [Acidisoma cladoniae]|jgi:shikimate kinase/3-dehydroquinate synthase|uniref:3-dehydroquinate synthase n=1 Tax=Acidisoma cladoniae TaxID=3040935 RepID=UPI002551900C|nr:3-dehydroquinate synthase [Acidisoma sp. PAMC 29798]
MHLMLVQRQRKHAKRKEAPTRHDQQEKNENQEELAHSATLPFETAAVLAWGVITRNTSLDADPLVPPSRLLGRSVVLVGLMGAGKTAVGKRLAQRLGLPFVDTDQEIESAAGYTVSEIFERFGEPAFRDVERRVLRRLLEGPRVVLATGGGAFMDRETRAMVRDKGLSIWIRAPLPLLLKRVAGRSHRPLLMSGEPATILQGLMDLRHPTYAEADITMDSRDEPVDAMATRTADAVLAHKPPTRVTVSLSDGGYDVVIGTGLLARAGGLLAQVLPQRRAIVVTDNTVAALHLDALRVGLEGAGFTVGTIAVPPGEASKTVESWAAVVDEMLAQAVERRTAIIALGGGVVGDLAGFAAAATLRGLPFVQVPTTLLAQVDSSVGGKTGINTRHGKNLIGAFHQPRMVLADTDVLATLPPRELRAGYAEIVKAGLIGDAAFYEWCEAHGAGVVTDDRDAQAEAIRRACAFKAGVVGDDEREEKPNDGRALLNLGHTFGHALEAEVGYGGELLHGEAVAIGLGLAFSLSAQLGYCSTEEVARVKRHIAAVGLPSDIGMLNRRFSAARLIGHMRKDKKMRDGALHFVLVRGIGQAFTTRDVPPDAVEALLRDAGCEP